MNTRRTKRHDDKEILDVVLSHKRLTAKSKKLTEKATNLEKENKTLKRKLEELTREMSLHTKTQRKRSSSSSKHSPPKRTSPKHTSPKHSSPKTATTFQISSKYNKYLKMKKMGVPTMMVKQSMMRDGVKPPSNVDLDKLTIKDIETILQNNNNSPKSSSPSMKNQLSTIQLKKATNSTNDVKKEYDKLNDIIDKYERKEDILNFVGFDNETRKNEVKMEHIKIVLDLIKNNKINATTGKAQLLKAINSNTKLIGVKTK